MLQSSLQWFLKQIACCLQWFFVEHALLKHLLIESALHLTEAGVDLGNWLVSGYQRCYGGEGTRGCSLWKCLKFKFSLNFFFSLRLCEWKFQKSFLVFLMFYCCWRNFWGYYRYCTLYCNLVQMSWRVKTILQRLKSVSWCHSLVHLKELFSILLSPLILCL